LSSGGSPHPEGAFDPNTPTLGAPGAPGAGEGPTSAGPGLTPGGRVGPYRLLTLLGEGGFGMVWLAERREPIVQRVALKVIKPGMDSRAVIARFEQERQALAVMDHPNVARVFDAGTTPGDGSGGGRPYFVMEYVKGEPINRFCDRMRLSVRQRLELFIPVCEAVQHAHHKGVIHRDLKPGNMLVVPTEPGDGSQTNGSRAVGVPKVIDFGISKAISHLMTDKTIYTEQGQVLGTPEYMSPEQADLGAVDVDTRADVYSLGVVLYELLAGVLPFGPDEIRGRGFVEVQRLIRETPAPRPSTKLAALSHGRDRIAESRRMGADELGTTLRTELEWIPLKALRKERNERYTSPSELAQDIRNYLEGRPLSAGPESGLYRLRKFVRRRRVPVIAGFLVFFALIGGTISTIMGMNWALRERAEARAAADREHAAATNAQEAEVAAIASRAEAERQRQQAQRTVAFLTGILSGADPEVSRGRELTVRAMLDEAAKRVDTELRDQPEVALEVHDVIAGAYRNLAQHARAAHHLERALVLARQSGLAGTLREADLLEALATTLFNLDRKTTRRNADLLEAALRIRESRLGADDPLTVRTSSDFGQVLGSLGDEAAHEKSFLSALRMLDPAHRGKSDEQLLQELEDWVDRVETLCTHGDREGAVREVVATNSPYLARPFIGDNIPSATCAFGEVVAARRPGSCAIGAFAIAGAAMARERWGPDSPRTATALEHAFLVHFKYGDMADAAKIGRECLTLRDLLSGSDNAPFVILRSQVGRAMAMTGQAAEGEAMVRASLANAATASQADLAWMRIHLSVCLLKAGRAADAEREAAQAAAYFEAVRDDEGITDIARWMEEICSALGKQEEARSWAQRRADAKKSSASGG
jgi:serine/threonine protein kinase